MRKGFENIGFNSVSGKGFCCSS